MVDLYELRRLSLFERVMGISSYQQIGRELAQGMLEGLENENKNKIIIK